MRVGGDAEDVTGGSVGDNNRNVAIGKGNRQTDYNNRINIYNDDERPQQHKSLEDRIMDMERVVYGEPRWSEPGLIKRQQKHLQISQWNMALNILMFLLLIAYVLWS